MNLAMLLITIVGGFVVLRALLLLFAAEMGRKQDLIKHIYKGGTDFQIAVVIPYLDSSKIGPLQELIQALDRQDYPATHLGVHIIASEESVFGLPNPEDLPHNVKVWTYPSRYPSRGQALNWMVERLLAAGGASKLFSFLEADDIIRPDYFKNVTTRAFDCFAMQGYIALKRPPRGAFASIVTLSMRLINRIENAGRFHLGLSCKFMDSGWIVRQEILEMIPFRQGNTSDNLEYAIQLNLNGYRINWAPNVVVYKDERANFVPQMRKNAFTFINHLGLTLRYVPQLLLQAITRFDLNAIEQAFSVVKLPNFALGTLGLLGVLVAVLFPALKLSAGVIGLLTLLFIAAQVTSLAVARCSLKDVAIFLVVTPFVYATGILMFPFFFVAAIAATMFKSLARPKRVRVGRRFDERQPELSALMPRYAPRNEARRSSQKTLALDDEFEAFQIEPPVSKPVVQASSDAFAAIYAQRLQASEPKIIEKEPTAFSSHEMFPDHSTSILPVSNGKNAVNCVLHTYKNFDEQGVPTYYLVFEYKSLAFTTQSYRILDQAYYELQSKLASKGFTILSCGSCAYFYHPTAGNSYGIGENQGYCLFGKMGRDIAFDAASINVLSPYCEHYTDMAQRSQVVQSWQESLNQLRT